MRRESYVTPEIKFTYPFLTVIKAVITAEERGLSKLSCRIFLECSHPELWSMLGWTSQ